MPKIVISKHYSNHLPLLSLAYNFSKHIFSPSLFMRSASIAAMLCTSSLALAGAQEKSFADIASKFVSVPAGEPASEMLEKAGEAVNHIKRMELPEASKSINEALQLDTRNSYLHFFNGFIYHLQARQGDSQKNEMAIEGYRQALRLDPSNWIAQEFLGLAYVDLKQFAHAKEQFSEVLLMSPDSSISMYGMMVASYMTADPVMACAMADQFSASSHEPHPEFIRSSIFVYASCGNFEKADEMRLALGKLNRGQTDETRVDKRLAQWKSFYRIQANSQAQAKLPISPANSFASAPASTNTAAGFIHAGLNPATLNASSTRLAALKTETEKDDDEDDEEPAKPAAASSKSSTATPAPTAPQKPVAASDAIPRMVLVDVVMVKTEELITTAKGINLLNALSLQLGSSSDAAYSNLRTDTTGSGASPVINTVIKAAVTIPALAYSLNIANANNMLNEVLARPTLAAIEGQPSEFFSGSNLNAGVVSASNLGTTSVIPIDKRFGVKLAVTPNFLPNGMVKLKVEALRTFLNANVDSAGFAYRLDISETSANANVVMNLGDTLVLSGLSEKEASNSRTGVPGLQDVPALQYLFSTKRNSDFQRSVLILITPRAPIFTSKMERGPDGTITDSMKALREKMGFAGRTPANIESIMGHLKTTQLFREFRQGDISLERWDRMHSTGDRLKQALEFLYY